MKNPGIRARRWALLPVLALLAAGVGEAARPPTGAPVKVGLLAPQTGDGAAEGRDLIRGAELAVKQINAAGGVKVRDGGAVRRAPLALVIGDDQSSPEASPEAARRLVEDEAVLVLTGGFSSATTLAAQPVVAASGTPFLITGASSPRVTRREDLDTSGMFHYYEIAPRDGAAAARFLAQEVRPAVAPERNLRVAAIYQDTAFGQDFLEGLPGEGLVGTVRTEKLPLEITTRQPFALGTEDFQSQLEAAYATQPDVIVPIGFVEETVHIIDQGVDRFGVSALFGPAPRAVENPAFFEMLAENTPIVTVESYFSTFDTPKGRTGKGVKKFRAAFQKAYRTLPGQRAATQYDAMYVLKAALELSSRLDRAALRDSLASVRVPPRVLPVENNVIQFDENHEVRFQLFVEQAYLARGTTKARIVWPRSLARGRFKVPDFGQ